MSAALLLATLTAFAAPGEPVVRLAASPTSVEVGEPFTLTLELEVDAERVLDRPFDEDEAFGSSWAVFDVTREAPRRAASAGRVVTRWRWSVASLEPGARPLGESFVANLDLGEVLAGEAPTITVASVLAPDETGPRPLIGFPDDLTLARAHVVPWLAVGAVGAVLFVLLAVSAWLWRRGRRLAGAGRAGTVVAPLATRVEELGLERLGALAGDELRDAVYALTSLVREAVDDRRGTRSPGLADDEWLAAVAAESRVDAATRERVASLLGRTAPIKYAGARPSAFALDELGRDARALFEALGGPAPREVAA